MSGTSDTMLNLWEMRLFRLLARLLSVDSQQSTSWYVPKENPKAPQYECHISIKHLLLGTNYFEL